MPDIVLRGMGNAVMNEIFTPWNLKSSGGRRS